MGICSTVSAVGVCHGPPEPVSATAVIVEPSGLMTACGTAGNVADRRNRRRPLVSAPPPDAGSSAQTSALAPPVLVPRTQYVFAFPGPCAHHCPKYASSLPLLVQDRLRTLNATFCPVFACQRLLAPVAVLTT